MTAADGPAIMVELAQPVAEAFALEGLRQPSTPRERAGSVGDARFRLGWSRPTLAFPADAPGCARLGLTIEGGVQLASGRILSLETFLTATAAPYSARNADGWCLRVASDQFEMTPLRLTYAGHELPPEPVRPAHGLPHDAELDALRVALGAEIRALALSLPDVPLTPQFPSAGREVQVQIAPEGQGAALVLRFATTSAAALPLVAQAAQNAAVLLNGAAFSAAFAEIVAPQVGQLLAPTLGLLTLDGTCAQDRLWFAAQGRVSIAEQPQTLVHATIETLPRLEDGHLRLEIERVVAESVPGGEQAAEAFGKALAAEIFARRLAELAGEAFCHAVAPAVGTALAQFTWQWAAPPGSALPAPAFTAAQGHVVEGCFALRGTLPLPAPLERADDLPELDLRVEGTPLPVDEGRRMQVPVRALARGAEPPCDYAWWTGTPGALLLDHTPTLDVLLRVAEDDPDDTVPRHLRTQPQITGIQTVRSALIDALGHVAEAVIEVDPTALSQPQPPLPANPAATSVPPATMSRPIPATGMQTRVGTAYQPSVARAQSRSWFVGFAAGILATFALASAMAAILLTRQTGATATTSGHPTPPPQTPTTVSHPTQVPRVPTPTPLPQVTVTPAPSPTPLLFARFQVSPQPAQATCTAGTPTPLTLTLTNAGNAQVSWQTATFVTTNTGTTRRAPWAQLVPASGVLAPSASASITLTPGSDFCPDTTDAFSVQFTATNGLAVPLNVTVTHN